jgi:hypothetical protein
MTFHGFFHFGEIAGKVVGHLGAGHGVLAYFPVHAVFHRDAHDAVGLRVEAVVAEFVPHVEHDEQAGGQAHGEARYVDGRKSLALPQAAQGDFEVVAEHKDVKNQDSGLQE